MAQDSVDILLVEDNPNDVELALHAFRKNKIGDRVHVARDGVEALDFIFCNGAFAGRDMSSGPTVVLLDLKLPLVDGVEVLRQMKADPRTKPIPVVVLTSSREERDILRTYELGANSYIFKPVDFDQFTQVVERLGHYWLLLNQRPIVRPGCCAVVQDEARQA